MNLQLFVRHFVAAALAAQAVGVGAQQLAAPPAAPAALSPAVLAPTNHPRLPRDLSQLWMAPEPGRSLTPAQNDFATAVTLELDGNFAKALPRFEQPALRQGPLAFYAEYYADLAKLRLGRLDEAGRAFRALESKNPVGYLAQAAAVREAEADEAMGDYAASLAVYERLARTRTITPEDVLMRLGHAAKLAGDADTAREAWSRVYYEYPLSDQALAAGAELASGAQAGAPSRFRLALARAERLFNAKRYAQARTEFTPLRTGAEGVDRQLVDLRIAECEYFLKRYRNARTSLGSFIDRPVRQSETLHFYALTFRDLHQVDEYLRLVRRVVAEFPGDLWTEAALNELGTYYIQQDEDEKADQTFQDLYARFPTGPSAERAAWKIGWWAYKNERDADTTRVFERAAADFPRSDYRPMWLYWSGRAHERLKETDLAIARYTLAVTDYGNSYYGRLARKRLDDRGARPPARPLIVDAGAPRSAVEGGDPTQAVGAPLPANAAVIRALLAIGLYDQAIDELHYAQKAWGTSSAIEATLAWAFWQQGRAEKGSDQFTLYRAAINAMKRAYPHYLATGGEELPAPLLRIIFPMVYWDRIQKYAALYGLDPYMAAALISQESTFVPDIKSYAHAVGLTQLLPSTARQYAKVVKLRYTPKLLTDPDANLRMGMAYFRDKLKEFGSVTLALASYNAGERPVHRWVTERPGVPDDEFVDDIPYPQTNNYVKKILGTAEDYRRLYGPELVQLEAQAADAAAPIGRSVSTKAPAKAAPPKRSSAKKAGGSTRSKAKKT